jgi:hypothetical protein
MAVKHSNRLVEQALRRVLKEGLLGDQRDQPGEVRDIYDNPQTQSAAWEFCQHWPEEILAGLCGQDAAGNSVPQQNIVSMLNHVEDLGDFTSEEWAKFFERVRVDGI